MDLNFLRNQAYQTAKAHGWHDEQRPDAHWLMLIITEISEAVQADRSGNRANTLEYKKHYNEMVSSVGDDRAFELSFEMWIKDTVEDELADVLIRTLDFAGIKAYDLDGMFNAAGDWGEIIDLPKSKSYFRDLDFTVLGLALTKCLTETIEDGFNIADPEQGVASLALLIKIVQMYSEQHGINLPWFVEMKMKYNETRPYKHGHKKY